MNSSVLMKKVHYPLRLNSLQQIFIQNVGYFQVKKLKKALKYGLRFGEMACFHRYSQDDKQQITFFVLQITDEGAAGFDLETLSTEQVKGLAFFLALPHSDVQNAGLWTVFRANVL